ncbi:amino acid transporter [Clostridium tetanomorphum]|uniref:APC family permease n=2 Tax=Clostridium TaxID=1485 RepID=A0A923EAU6_CLOTT|nr:APC family permease [Clostridium tetanomorphum]KAJ51274.1 amino acid permease rocC [Clostridium tetanomorphum DSM 665]MBC2397861.1 APC family permease [Clostridium tetanomorphum]MBP1864824.1 amino acid transporter [Clostridium tetanomorphum]NRS84000.1 amino acid transporter [Clostridium tetanomorphum]NRZ97218.1 amino acid transporter [Clostridium tetanomorphum]
MSTGTPTKDTGMKKTLSLWNFFTIGFGAIIGTGWVLLVGDWMIIGGGPTAAIIAFIIGSLFLLPIGAVFGELTAAIPVSGGIVEYVSRTFGNKLSYFTGWFLALGNGILCPWEAIAISSLVGEFIPALKIIPLYEIMGATVYLPPLIVSLIFAGYVIRLNFKGASAAAKLQGFLTKLLLAGMVIAMGISLFRGGPKNLHPIYRAANSGARGSSSIWMGILPVLVMTPFFYAGFDTIPQQAEEAAEGLDWNKFGKVISMALMAAGIFYMICIYSFGTIVPWEEFVTYNIPALTILSVIGLKIFSKVMMFIAIMGPLGPMNSFFGATTRILLAMGRKGQLPEKFSELDKKNGTPKAANTLMAILTIMGPFLGNKMLVPLTNVSSLAFIFACFMVSAACLRMRRTEPNINRPYKVPGGKIGISLACITALIIIGLLVIPGSPASLNSVEWSVVMIWFLIGLTLMFVRNRNVKKAISKNGVSN